MEEKWVLYIAIQYNKKSRVFDVAIQHNKKRGYLMLLNVTTRGAFDVAIQCHNKKRGEFDVAVQFTKCRKGKGGYQNCLHTNYHAVLIMYSKLC